MSHLGFKVCGQVDNVDGAEGTLLDTDTTSYAQAFGNEGNFRLGGYFDTELASPYNWAGLFAFLTAFLVYRSAR